MKRTRLLNSELSHAISCLGHTDSLTLCDAGLPIPPGVKRIDLAIERGYPAFLTTLDVMLSEMMVEQVIVAKELIEKNEEFFLAILNLFGNHAMKPRVIEVTHEEFKQLTMDSRAVIRTGECTPYANLILQSGVVF